MKDRRRKIITPVIVFLLLGAIINVAVAWLISYFVRAPNNTGNPLARGFKQVEGCSELQSPLVNGWATHKVVRQLRRPGTRLVVVTIVSRPASPSASFASILPPACPLSEVDTRERLTRMSGEEFGFFYWD